MKRISIIFLILLSISFFYSCNNTITQDFSKFDTLAMYSDGTDQYVYPSEPKKTDSVMVKVRTRRGNASEAILHYEDVSIQMVFAGTDSVFDYYVASIPPHDTTYTYYFEIKQNDKVAFISRLGVETKIPKSINQFKIIPEFKVPEWMKGAVLYQIFTDRFFNGDTTNDVETNEYLYDNWPSIKVTDWFQKPDGTPYAQGSNRTREFFGGDIEGIIQKLGYLKELGIDGIYCNPMFVSPSNHKYDTQDYNNIDPHLGKIVKDGGSLIDPNKDPIFKSGTFGASSIVNQTATKYIIRTTSPQNLEASNAKMKELVDKAHSSGIKVILDGVFNHSGSFNEWFDREHIYSGQNGAYESKLSPYAKYYNFSENQWPNNESYESWAGFKTLPKLFFENSKDLTNNILNIGAKWVGQDYNVDGWRLDVAADLGYTPNFNHSFWQQFRNSVKSANKNAVILAEVYGDSSQWLKGNEWDTIMNYDAFFEPLSWFLTGLEKHSYYKDDKLLNNTRAFDLSLKTTMARMPFNSMLIAMNQLSNHDHSRFLTRTNSYVDSSRSTSDVSNIEIADKDLNKGILKEATVLQMTFPGAPTLYYGDEAGLAGLTDPDCRRTYPWGKEDTELISFYKDIISLHKKYSCIPFGGLVTLSATENGLYSYARWDANARIIVAINNNAVEKKLTIPLASLYNIEGEEFKTIFISDKDTHEQKGLAYKVNSKKIEVSIPAFGSLILASNNGVPEPSLKKVSLPTIKSCISDEKGNIVVEFSQSMNQRSILSAFKVMPEIKGVFAMNGSRLTFTPTQPLVSGTYEIMIDTTLTSRVGNLPLQEPKKFSFTIK